VTVLGRLERAEGAAVGGSSCGTSGSRVFLFLPWLGSAPCMADRGSRLDFFPRALRPPFFLLTLALLSGAGSPTLRVSFASRSVASGWLSAAEGLSSPALGLSGSASWADSGSSLALELIWLNHSFVIHIANARVLLRVPSGIVFMHILGIRSITDVIAILRGRVVALCVAVIRARIDI